LQILINYSHKTSNNIGPQKGEECDCGTILQCLAARLALLNPPTHIRETERWRNSETAREKRKIETELYIDREEKRCIEQRKIENMTLRDR
jgi:hypothetical protein